jgi:hypothetical protein
MLMLHYGRRATKKRVSNLPRRYPNAQVGATGDVGLFDVTLEAENLDDAPGPPWRRPAPTTALCSSSILSCRSTGARSGRPGGSGT